MRKRSILVIKHKGDNLSFGWDMVSFNGRKAPLTGEKWSDYGFTLDEGQFIQGLAQYVFAKVLQCHRDRLMSV